MAVSLGVAKRSELQVPQPPTISLLTAAPIVPEDDLRWEQGYEFLQRGVGQQGTGVVNPDSDVMPKSTVPSDLTKELWHPFLVVAGLTDSAFEYNALDWELRVRDNLAVAESTLIEKEAWTNSTANGAAKIGGAGSGATDVDPGNSLSPGKAIAALVGQWANTSNGVRGYIHTSEQVLMLLEENWAVRREGNLWLTACDNVIIPGRGYVLDGPAGQPYGLTTSEWMYMTATPYVRLGPVEIIPPSYPGTLMQAMTRPSNDVTIYAARLASVSWDTLAPHLCVKVDKT